MLLAPGLGPQFYRLQRYIVDCILFRNLHYGWGIKKLSNEKL